jgi:hypothetical protein
MKGEEYTSRRVLQERQSAPTRGYDDRRIEFGRSSHCAECAGECRPLQWTRFLIFTFPALLCRAFTFLRFAVGV